MAKPGRPDVPAREDPTTRPGWLLPVAVSVLIAAIVGFIAISLFPTPPVLRDALGYTMTAQRLIERGEFAFGVQPPSVDASPNALVTPGHVVFLAGVYGLTPGRSADASATAVAVQPVLQGVQFMLALLAVALIAGSGYALGGRRISYIAGILAALYLPLWWSTTVALSECVAFTLAAAQLLLAVLLVAQKPARETWLLVGLGAVSAGLTLVRPVAALWVVVPFVYLAARRTYEWRRLGRMAGIALAGFLLLMAPWWVRNTIVLGEFVPLSTGAGNPMLLSTGGYPLTPDEQAVFDSADARGKNPESEVALYRLGQQFREAPLLLLSSRLGYGLGVTTEAWMVPRDAIWEELYDAEAPRIAFGAFPQEPSGALSNAMEFARLYQLFLLGAALVSLAFVKLAPRLVLVALVPLYFVLIHFFTLFINRYFFPAMPAVIVMAAAGLFAAVRSGSRLMRRGSAQ